MRRKTANTEYTAVRYSVPQSQMTAPSHGIQPSGQVNSRNARLIQHHDMNSSMFFDRGLFNKAGENNCFLNSAIQVLWHIDVFRRSFRELNGHYCVGDSCIFCALKVIFTQYQYTSESAIPPNALRSALATCFKVQHKFQLGLMEDASECYEEILGQMHFHLTGNHDDDTCDIPHCISHQKFALTLLERTECRCGATSEPLPMVQFIHYYSVTALLEEFNKVKGLKQSVEKDPKLFSMMLHNAYCIDNNRECPNYLNCHQEVRPAQILLNALDVVCIGLIWDSDQPTVKLIQLLSDAIGLEIKLSSLFDQILIKEVNARDYHLTAVITYYGKHYSTFCYHGKHREWVYLDDANVRKVGKKWSDVKELFKKGHYQPLLLLYTCPSATPIDATTALTTDIVTMETTSTNAATTATTADTVDMTTVATTNQSELHTNATPTENLIVGVGGHGNTTQPHFPANPQDAIVPMLPPPPHVDRTHRNNMVTNVMLPMTRSSPRASPTPVDNTPRAPPKGTSPVCNTDSNNESEDLMTFESVSTQLIAAANHNPFPTHKLHLYPSNMLTNEIPPLSATNQPHVHSSGGQASIFHSRVNAAATNSNPQTNEGDLIVLDTLKATEVVKIKQKSLAVNHLTGLFEQDMIVIDSSHSTTAVDDKSNANHSSSVEVVTSTAMGHPYPRGVTTTNSSTIGVVTSANMRDISHPHPSGVTTTNHSSSIGMVSSTTMDDKSYPHPRGVTATNSSSVGVVTSMAISNKSHPHPRGITATNHSSIVTSTAMDDKSHPHPAGVVTDRISQSAATNTNAHHSSPRQYLRSTAMASHRAANQIQASQLSHRDGFGVSQADVLCVEAIQMWVKAEMSLAQGDTAVALLAYQQASEILQRALQDIQVHSNTKRRAQLTSKRDDAIARADSLKKTMAEKKRHGQTSPQPSHHHQQQYSNAQLCRRCGQIDHKLGSELCGPCELKEKYKM